MGRISKLTPCGQKQYHPSPSLGYADDRLTAASYPVGFLQHLGSQFIMPRLLITALLPVVLAAGCNKAMKVDNPVAGPPPPRRGYDETLPEAEPGRVIVSAVNEQFSAFAAVPLDGLEVAAVVNSEPIFAEDLLATYALKLREAQEQIAAIPLERERRAAEASLRQQREKLIEDSLPAYVERKLLAQALKEDLKEEQLRMLDAQLKARFQQRLEETKKRLNVTTLADLKLEMAKHGMTLERMRDSFYEQETAQQYVLLKARPKTTFSRSELLHYYDDHVDEYRVTGRVKWQQIFVSVREAGSQRAARKEIGQAAAKLNAGASFAEVAKEHPDGPTASAGGEWDWTEPGSLTSEEVENVLFGIPVGRVSQILSDKAGYHIVKVLDRVDPGVTPFSELHDKIGEILKREESRAATESLLEKLHDKAVIETEYRFAPRYEIEQAEAIQ